MTSAKQLLGNKNFRNCFPFGDKLGSLDVECLAGEGPGPLGAAGPGAPNGFGAFEFISATPGGCHKFHSAPGVPWLCSKVSPLMDHILFRICLSKSFRPSCPSLWQK